MVVGSSWIAEWAELLLREVARGAGSVLAAAVTRPAEVCEQVPACPLVPACPAAPACPACECRGLEVSVEVSLILSVGVSGCLLVVFVGGWACGRFGRRRAVIASGSRALKDERFLLNAGGKW